MPQIPTIEPHQVQMEAAMRMARIALDGAEKLLHLQLDTAKQTVEDAARHAARLAEAKDMQAAMAIRAELSEHTMNAMMELSRNIYELAMQTQTELMRQTESQLGTGHQAVLGGLATFPAMPGAEAFAHAMKSSIAASQAAYDSMSKAARQVAEFADTSLKAATTATASAVKENTRRR